jgi:hypothetical protein
MACTGLRPIVPCRSQLEIDVIEDSPREPACGELFTCARATQASAAAPCALCPLLHTKCRSHPSVARKSVLQIPAFGLRQEIFC